MVVEMIRKAVQLCELQRKLNQVFIFEHPLAADTWDLECMKKLLELPGVGKVRLDMCEYGIVSTDKLGEGPPTNQQG